MAYQNPNWANGQAPAISAENLNEMSDAIELLPVENGGTGKNEITSGAILKGNGTSAVAELSGTGALYAQSNNNPQFGTLPVNCGGTGSSTLAAFKSALGLTTAGFVVSNTEPVSHDVLWIDTANDSLMKYYDNDNSVWVAIRGAFA